jgi:lipoate-protein ligase B
MFYSASPKTPESALAVLDVRRLGTVPYADALALQSALVRARRDGTTPDTLLLLEHPHVITLGSDAHAEHVLADDAERRLLGIELFEVGRGGDVTYHGPGQLVGYPILDLKPDRKDLHRYLRDLEAVLIDALTAFGVAAQRREGLTGVWTRGGKIAAIGVRVSSGWITSHGFALNVGTDLRYFDAIVPCGIPGESVTSLARELGRPVPMEDVQAAVADAFARVFGRRIAQAGASPSSWTFSGGTPSR